MADETDTKKKCFVVGPIGESESDTRNHADWLLQGIIQPVMDEIGGFDVVRADQISQPGMIDAQVIEHLLDADLVIADLSQGNATAFYEIGIRHMVQKPIIHMQLAGEKIPFDVSLYRAIRFTCSHPDDLQKACGKLKRAVESVLEDGYRTDNPVTRARGQIEFEQTATPEQQLLLGQVRSIQRRLDAIEKNDPRSTTLSGGVGYTDSGSTIYIDELYIHLDRKKFTEENRRILFSLLSAGSPFIEPKEEMSGLIKITVREDFKDTSLWQSIQHEVLNVPGVTEISPVPF